MIELAGVVNQWEGSRAVLVWRGCWVHGLHKKISVMEDWDRRRSNRFPCLCLVMHTVHGTASCR